MLIFDYLIRNLFFLFPLGSFGDKIGRFIFGKLVTTCQELDIRRKTGKNLAVYGIEEDLQTF